MNKLYVLLIFVIINFNLIFSENRVALVIGNGSYSISPLKNPVGDAKDMAKSLENLNFEVILLTDSTKREILSGFKTFSNKLSPDSVGLFYYAGHGTQIDSKNYLIPIGANIEIASDVEFEGVVLDRLIRTMENSKVNKSLIFLDACRDNPYVSSSRSGSRGLTVVSAKSSEGSAGSLISFATSPGSIAADGDGNNGTFTTALLKYMSEPGLEINQVMTKVRADVMGNTDGKQQPWTNVSLTEDFFFVEQVTFNTPTNNTIIFEELYGSLKIRVVEAGQLYLNDKMVKSFNIGESIKIPKLVTGSHNLKYISNGYIDSQNIIVSENKISIVNFLGKRIPTSVAKIKPSSVVKNTVKRKNIQPTIELILVKAGTFEMGSKIGNNYSKPKHIVIISKDFNIGKFEVTQKQWKDIMGNNPSHFKGDNYPVESVSWRDTLEFCNKLSIAEGLIPAYIIKDNKVTIDKSSNGFRLPTEAQWEFAGKGGVNSQTFTFSGSNTYEDVSWNKNNAKNQTHNVGSKYPNEIGIYDMSGNVFEWCWDLIGSYQKNKVTDPTGSTTGSLRVRRGGSWVNNASFLSIIDRNGYGQSLKSNNLGFRVVLPIE